MYFRHRVIQVRLQPSNSSSCCIFASCCLLFPFLLFILRDRKTGRKKKKRHCCSASSKTSFMGWPCSLTLLTPRMWERILEKQYTQLSLDCSGSWPERSAEGALFISLLPEKWLAQHRFKDERHQARDREGLHLLKGARRTKQFLLWRKRGKKSWEKTL